MREWSGDPDDDEGWQQDADRERDSACFPPSDELCAVLPMEIVCASGPWGAVRVREALVYSSGLALELEEVLLRTVESKEEWWSNEGQLDNGHHESRPRLKRLSGESSVRFAGGSGSSERSRRATFHRFWVSGPFEAAKIPFSFSTSLVASGEVHFELSGSDVVDAQSRVRRLGIA